MGTRFNGRWRPNKREALDFAEKMHEIDMFCFEHRIQKSRSSDSYYFTVDGTNYRVSNHTIEASNRGAIDREPYHPSKRDPNVVYIHASKTRIIEIYNDITAGYKLDGRGRRKEENNK